MSDIRVTFHAMERFLSRFPDHNFTVSLRRAVWVRTTGENYADNGRLRYSLSGNEYYLIDRLAKAAFVVKNDLVVTVVKIEPRGTYTPRKKRSSP